MGTRPSSADFEERIGFLSDRGWQLHTDGLIVGPDRGLLTETPEKHGFSGSVGHMAVLGAEKPNPLELSVGDELVYACPAERANFSLFSRRCGNEREYALYSSRYSAIELPCYEDAYDGGVCVLGGKCHKVTEYGYVTDPKFPFACAEYTIESGKLVDVFEDARKIERRRVLDECAEGIHGKAFAVVV